MSDQTENAIKKAITSKFGKVGIDADTEVTFRGKVEFELDVTVSRGKDIEVLPRTDVPIGLILGLLANKARVEPNEVNEFILKVWAEGVQQQDKLLRYMDAVEESLEKLRKSIQATAKKESKAAPTQVDGVVRFLKSIPKK